MTDESLNMVLEGIIGQSFFDNQKGTIKMQHLQQLIYSNNELGVKSLKNIKTLIPNLFDLGFNNIKIEGGYLDGRRYNSWELIEEILRTVAMEGTKLIRLKLTKMNLRSEGIIQQIIETLTYNDNIIQLDLAFSQLVPKQLNVLAHGISEKGFNLRQLNLSYNALNQEGADPEDSEQFLLNINELVNTAKYMNHVNFSGMNLKKA